MSRPSPALLAAPCSAYRLHSAIGTAASVPGGRGAPMGRRANGEGSVYRLPGKMDGRGVPDSTAQPLAGRYRGAPRHPLRAGHGHVGRVRLPDLPDTGDSETGHTPSCDFSLACSASRTRLICGGEGSRSLVARTRVVLCSPSDDLPPVCWPGSCACRNLRIRTRATLGRVGAQAPDLRGHWVYKGENEVGSALILRLRQNQAPNPAGAVYNPPSPLQVRGEAG